MKSIKKSKRGAIELSMTTIVVVVLALTLLIMGFVLIRSIMCTAIGMTGTINDKITQQINDFFSESGEEVYCIGQADAVKVSTGMNNIFCGFNSKTNAEYTIKIKEIKALSNTIPKDTPFTSWIADKVESISISPDQKEARKTVTMQIPDDAPEGAIRIIIEVKKAGASWVKTISVDWEISRKGVIRSVLC
ncbi:MAG: hypothetical protein WC796_05770 [Candidatus Pacearchaeota archaeon]|jgi:hypothetical protein